MHTELREIAVIEAKSIGWMSLGDGAYVHINNPDEEEVVLTVTSVLMRCHFSA